MLEYDSLFKEAVFGEEDFDEGGGDILFEPDPLTNLLQSMDKPSTLDTNNFVHDMDDFAYLLFELGLEDCAPLFGDDKLIYEPAGIELAETQALTYSTLTCNGTSQLSPLLNKGKGK
jgi:hypothetical protein